MAGKPRQNDNSLITLLQKRCFLETSKKNPLELLYFNTQGGVETIFYLYICIVV